MGSTIFQLYFCVAMLTRCSPPLLLPLHDPLAIGVAHSYALSFHDVLVPDGGEEAVDEARGEEAARFIPGRLIESGPDALAALPYFYRLVHGNFSDFAVFQEVENTLYSLIVPYPRVHEAFADPLSDLGASHPPRYSVSFSTHSRITL